MTASVYIQWFQIEDFSNGSECTSLYSDVLMFQSSMRRFALQDLLYKVARVRPGLENKIN